jgi:hypothetical protein
VAKCIFAMNIHKTAAVTALFVCVLTLCSPVLALAAGSFSPEAGICGPCSVGGNKANNDILCCVLPCQTGTCFFAMDTATAYSVANIPICMLGINQSEQPAITRTASPIFRPPKI